MSPADDRPADPDHVEEVANMRVAAVKPLNDTAPVPPEIKEAMRTMGLLLQCAVHTCMQVCTDERDGQKRVVVCAVLPEQRDVISLGGDPETSPLVIIPNAADLKALGFEEVT